MRSPRQTSCGRFRMKPTDPSSGSWWLRKRMLLRKLGSSRVGRATSREPVWISVLELCCRSLIPSFLAWRPLRSIRSSGGGTFFSKGAPKVPTQEKTRNLLSLGSVSVFISTLFRRNRRRGNLFADPFITFQTTSHGQRNHRTNQASDPRRTGQSSTSGRPRARSTGCQHHGLLQGVQRRHDASRHPGGSGSLPDELTSTKATKDHHHAPRETHDR